MSRQAVEVREVVPSDVEELVANMRDQDKAECAAGGHDDLKATVESGVKDSAWCRTVTIGGKVAAILGVVRVGTVLDPAGLPWMLGTDLVPQNRRALASLSRQYLPAMLQEYRRLVNVVHARNDVSVRWLRRLGFTVHPAQNVPPRGEPFHLFEMRA